ncbi:hypothetical protein OU426_09155 [Frigidibacter sp. RF13]|uniref:hypothetical protein n=1 Tax=Frigidibacter sp. RF13 TaxID=2997340 RepID=UPI0022708102|nr:hypothetical protein [Frigidibacter sp. RF13]MCY1127022.1 hypothetical protein [Frigidibacter sp. RF13]
MRSFLSVSLLLLGLPAAAGELARVEGTWADGSAYTAILTDEGEDGQARIMIYDPASAQGEAGGDPWVDNPALTGIFDEVAMEASADGTLVVKTRSVIPDQVIFNEIFTIGQWDGEIAVRRYQILFGDPASPEAEPGLFCDADVAAGRITWPDPEMQRDPSLPMPGAADMRLQDWTMNRATSVDPGLGLCIAFG